MKRRDLFAAALAPAFAAEFLRAGDAWDDYDDLSESIYLAADALDEQARKAEQPKKKKRGAA